MKYFLALFVFFPLKAFSLSFSPFIAISPSGPNSSPQVAVALGGDAMAIWTNFPHSVEIQTAFYQAATNQWTFLGTLAAGSSAKIGINAIGQATAVWVHQNNIFTSRFRVVTQTWGPVIQLSVAGQNSSPEIAVSPLGVVVVVWIQNGPNQILSRSYNPETQTWSAPIQISEYPAQYGLDINNKGIAVRLQIPSGVVQASRITGP